RDAIRAPTLPRAAPDLSLPAFLQADRLRRALRDAQYRAVRPRTAPPRRHGDGVRQRDARPGGWGRPRGGRGACAVPPAPRGASAAQRCRRVAANAAASLAEHDATLPRAGPVLPGSLAGYGTGAPPGPGPCRTLQLRLPFHVRGR